MYIDREYSVSIFHSSALFLDDASASNRMNGAGLSFVLAARLDRCKKRH